MPTILRAIPFDADLLPLVYDFDCAETEPSTFWEEEINEWIRQDPAEGDGALFWLDQDKGTQVWLYADEHDAIVGYGALCPSRWPDPEVVVAVPKLKKIRSPSSPPSASTGASSVGRRGQNVRNGTPRRS